MSAQNPFLAIREQEEKKRKQEAPENPFLAIRKQAEQDPGKSGAVDLRSPAFAADPFKPKPVEEYSDEEMFNAAFGPGSIPVESAYDLQKRKYDAQRTYAQTQLPDRSALSNFMNRTFVRGGLNMRETFTKVYRRLGIPGAEDVLDQIAKARSTMEKYRPSKAEALAGIDEAQKLELGNRANPLFASDFGNASESMMTSVAAMLPGMLMKKSPVGAAMSTGLIFGVANYDDFIEDYKRHKGNEPGAVERMQGAGTALLSGSLEGLGALFELAGAGQAGRTVAAPAKTYLEKILRGIGYADLAGMGEGLTEAAQGAVDAQLRVHHALPTDSPMDAAAKSFGPGFMAGLMFGGPQAVKVVRDLAVGQGIPEKVLDANPDVVEKVAKELEGVAHDIPVPGKQADEQSRSGDDQWIKDQVNSALEADKTPNPLIKSEDAFGQKREEVAQAADAPELELPRATTVDASGNAIKTNERVAYTSPTTGRSVTGRVVSVSEDGLSVEVEDRNGSRFPIERAQVIRYDPKQAAGARLDMEADLLDEVDAKREQLGGLLDELNRIREGVADGSIQTGKIFLDDHQNMEETGFTKRVMNAGSAYPEGMSKDTIAAVQNALAGKPLTRSQYNRVEAALRHVTSQGAAEGHTVITRNDALNQTEGVNLSIVQTGKPYIEEVRGQDLETGDVIRDAETGELMLVERTDAGELVLRDGEVRILDGSESVITTGVVPLNAPGHAEAKSAWNRNEEDVASFTELAMDLQDVEQAAAIFSGDPEAVIPGEGNVNAEAVSPGEETGEAEGNPRLELPNGYILEVDKDTGVPSWIRPDGSKRVANRNNPEEKAILRAADVSMNAVEIEEVLQQLAGLLPVVDGVKLVDTAKDLPSEVIEDLLARGIDVEKVGGIWNGDNNAVFLVRSRIYGPDDVTRLILHEVVGHLGVRNAFSEERLSQILTDVWNGVPDAVRTKIVESYKLDPTNIGDAIEAAEEILAHAAGVGEVVAQWYNKFVAAITAMLRKLGVRTWTKHDTRVVLDQARKYLLEQEGVSHPELIGRAHADQYAANLGFEGDLRGKVAERLANDWARVQRNPDTRYSLDSYPEADPEPVGKDPQLEWDALLNEAGASLPAELEQRRLEELRNALSDPARANWERVWQYGQKAGTVIHQLWRGEVHSFNIRGMKIESPRDVAAVMAHLRSPYQESMKVIFLDRNDRVTHSEVNTLGILNASLVHPREIFKSAVAKGTTKIVLSHNHPSGDLSPSPEDLKITRELIAAGKVLGIRVVDHVISNGGHLSLKGSGLVDFDFGNTKPVSGKGSVQKKDYIEPLDYNPDALAEWELVPTRERVPISSPESAEPIIKAMRAVKDEANHIQFLMLDIRNKITGVMRVPLDRAVGADGEFVKGHFPEIFEFAANNGTAQMIVDLPAGSFNVAQAMKLAKLYGTAAATMEMPVVDVMRSGEGVFESLRSYGFYNPDSMRAQIREGGAKFELQPDKVRENQQRNGSSPEQSSTAPRNSSSEVSTGVLPVTEGSAGSAPSNPAGIDSPGRRPRLSLDPASPGEVRGFADRISEMPEYAALISRLEQDGRTTYEPQNMAELADRTEQMTQAERWQILQAGQRTGKPPAGLDDLQVFAGISLLNDYTAQGAHDAAADVVARLSEQGTYFGQMVRHFGELKKSNPLHLASAIEASLKKKGRILTTAERQVLIGLASADIAARRRVRSAEEYLRGMWNPINIEMADRAMMEAESRSRQLMDWIGSVSPREFGKLFETLLQGNLLTPMSQVKNITGNLLYWIIQDTVKNFWAAPIDMIISKVTGRERTALFTFADLPAGLAAMMRSIPDVYREFVHGPMDSKAIAGEQMRQLAPFRSFVQALSGEGLQRYGDQLGEIKPQQRLLALLEGTLGIPAAVSLRALQFGDVPIRRGREAMLASEQARIRGLKGTAKKIYERFPDRRGKLIILEESKEAVFQQDNAFADWINHGLKALGEWGPAGPAMRLLARTVIPFVKTPTNLVLEGLNFMIPELSFAKALWYASKGERRKSLFASGKALVGSMMFRGSYWMALQGLISGEPDDSDKMRGLQYGTLPPNSLNISGLRRALAGGDPSWRAGDETINYLNGLGYLGLVIGVVASRHGRAEKDEENQGRNMDHRSKDYIATMIAALPEVASAAFEMSMMKGVAGLLEALQNEQYGNWLESTFKAASSIALPNTLDAINRSRMEQMVVLSGDSTVQTFANVIKFKLMNTEDMPLRLDLFGRAIPQTPEGGNPLLYAFLDPLKSRKIVDDPVMRTTYDIYKETLDESAVPSVPSRRITLRGSLIRLTVAQYEQLQYEVGRARLDGFAKRIRSNPHWKTKTAEQKLALIKDVWNDGNRIGRANFVRTYQTTYQMPGRTNQGFTGR